MTAWPFPAPVDDGKAGHLRGLALPDLPLPSTLGEAVNLARRPGRCVLFIYPWTGRPGLANPPGWDDVPGAHGSTPEAEGFRDHHRAFEDERVAVFGLSTQPTSYQRELADRLHLPFDLLSDDGFAFASALGLPTFLTGGVTYLKRMTFIVRDGHIEHVFYPVHPPDTHAAEVLDRLRGSEPPA